MLAAFAVVGWRLPEATWVQVTLAVTLPVVAAGVWGLLVSPKARVRAPLPVRLVVEITLFGTASVLLWVTGSPVAAIALAAAEAIVLVGLLATGNPPGSTTERPIDGPR